MVRIKYITDGKMKGKAVVETSSGLDSIEEEVPLSRYWKRSVGITINEPTAKKANTIEKLMAYKRNFIPRYIQWDVFSSFDFRLIELFDGQG